MLEEIGSLCEIKILTIRPRTAILRPTGLSQPLKPFGQLRRHPVDLRERGESNDK
jgi:hypothetical protein